MKLRLRSLQSKETQKLEVPNECSIQQLKELLSQAISSTSSLRLSLNGKDELSSPSPHDSLLSIGITSGDLIYYDFSSASAQQGNVLSNLQDSNVGNPDMDVKPESVVQGISLSEKSLCEASDLKFQESCEISEESDVEILGCRDKGKQILVEDLNLEIAESRGVECSDVYSDSDFKRFSEPYFLKRVLCEQMGDDFSVTKLVFLAIHAVFLESGFVGFDSISRLRVDLFDILKEQASMTFTTTVSYTVPELLCGDDDTESVVLKFQTLGHYVNVYGSLAKSQAGLHKLNIDKSRFVPAIGSFWVSGDGSDRMNQIDSSMAYAEKVVFEFWKLVKDGLALPLMIDLCEKTGLDLPPCLIRLPADIKLRILEFLPGQDIARMACVCKEMRYLSSNNELWKGTYMLEFGSGTGAVARAGDATNWKRMFVSVWENTKKRKRGIDNSHIYGPFRFGNPQPRVVIERRDPGDDARRQMLHLLRAPRRNYNFGGFNV